MQPPSPRPLAYSYARLSSPAQRKGDGLRRQLEAARAFAEKEGLELVERNDSGKSAYHGAHIEDGELGKFIEQVNAGQIPIGTHLIVELLDRISRLQPAKALMVFLPLIEKGIVVATLIDKKIYKRPVDQFDLFSSMVIFAQAHEFSETRSYRGKKNWERKRGLARSQKTKMTKQCPGWLRLRDDGTFEIDEARASVVRRIFADAATGLGSYAIMRRLNAEGVPSFRSGGWAKSSVRNILANPNVIGRLKVHTFQDGKRVPEGDEIDGYYPPIIDAELFFKANAARADHKRTGKGGRLGVDVANLFSGRLACARCGKAAHYRNKGDPPKGGKYLVCSSAERNLPCSAKSWTYAKFERSVLAFISQLDVSAIVSEGKRSDEIGELESEYNALQTHEMNLIKRRDFLDRLMDAGPLSEERFVEYRKHETDIIETRKRLTQIESSLASHRAPPLSDIELREAIRAIQDERTPDRAKLRSQAASKIRQIVEHIEIGFEPLAKHLTHRLGGRLAETLRDVANETPDRAFAAGILNSPFFVVHLRDGTRVTVQPDPNDAERVYTFGSLTSDERASIFARLFGGLENVKYEAV